MTAWQETAALMFAPGDTGERRRHDRRTRGRSGGRRTGDERARPCRRLPRRMKRARETGPTAGWDYETTQQAAARIAAELAAGKAPRDPWLGALRVATALLFIMSGLSLVAGPRQWRSAGAFAVVAMIPGGVRMLGGLMLAAGLVLGYTLLRRHYFATRVMFIVGAVITATAGFSFLAAGLIGKLTGGTGPWFWLYAAFVMLVQAGRVRRNG